MNSLKNSEDKYQRKSGQMTESDGPKSKTFTVKFRNDKNNVLADGGVVMVSRSGSRSVVPTAAVLAAELIKRTTPPSVVGVPKCRKKL